MGIERIDTTRCAACGQCDLVCPMDVIYFDARQKRPRIQYPEDCQSCYLCVLACARRLISVTPARCQRLPACALPGAPDLNQRMENACDR